jgi:type II secretory pathway pseudopilin PulG
MSLLELILAVILMSLIGLSFTSVSVFSRQNVIVADKRTKLQNSITFVLEHMAKNIARAIGDTNNFPINNTPVNGETAIEIKIDSNNNGMLDPVTDLQVAYSHNTTNYQLNYYPNYYNNSVYDNSTYEVLAYNITTDLSAGNVTYNNTTNYVTVKLSGRLDPANSTISPTNPQVNMTTVMQMPSVSVN